MIIAAQPGLNNFWEGVTSPQTESIAANGSNLFQVLLNESFDNLDKWYTQGGVSLGEGYASLKGGSMLDDGRGGRGINWQYVNAQFNIQCSPGEDVAYRVWGFIECLPSHPGNFLVFVQYPVGSDESLVGFRAQVAIDDEIVRSVRIEDVDLTQPHDYTIIWEPNNVTLLIDNDVVLTTDKAPQVPLSIAMINQEWTYRAPTDSHGNVVMTGTVDDIENVWIQVHDVRVFMDQDLLQEHAANASRTLSKFYSLIQTAQQRGLDTQRMRDDYTASIEDLGDGYVHAELLSKLRLANDMLPAYLDDLSELFPAAQQRILQSVGSDATRLQGFYSLAEMTWEKYDYPATLDYLEKIMKQE
jgi:hypothetical protein